MPPYVKVVDPSTLIIPLLPPRAIPLLELSVKSAVDCKAPPFRIKRPAVTDPGAAPRPLSAAMLIVPAEIVVVPV